LQNRVQVRGKNLSYLCPFFSFSGFVWCGYFIYLDVYMLLNKEIFDIWNENKKVVNNRNDVDQFYVKPREIRYVKLWVNIWFEQNGKWEFQRPVLVIERIWVLFLIVPLSTKQKDNPFYYKLNSTSFDKPSMAILSQIRVIDKKRFINPIWSVSITEFLTIKKLLKDIYLKGV